MKEAAMMSPEESHLYQVNAMLRRSIAQMKRLLWVLTILFVISLVMGWGAWVSATIVAAFIWAAVKSKRLSRARREVRREIWEMNAYRD
jgi:hypothetical protein